MAVLLARHGQTALNRGAGGPEKIRGFADVPLDEKGERQAVELAVHLSQRPVTMIYTSPLIRARQTARVVSKTCGAPMSINRALLPWQLGELQGQCVDDVLPAIKYYADNPLKAPKNGEPFQKFVERFLPFLADTLQRAKMRTGDFVLVSHSRNLQLAKGWNKKGRPDDYSYDSKEVNDYSKEIPTSDFLVLDA